MHVNACQRFRLEQTEALEALITGKKVLWLWKEPHLLGVLFHKILSIDFFSLIFFHIHRKGGNTCGLGYLTQGEQQT